MSYLCSGLGGSSSAKFDDPFLLPSSEFLPTSMNETWDFCRYMYLNNPEYRKAMQRVTRHFINELVIGGTESAKEKEETEDFLVYKLGLKTALAELGDDWSCYGQAYYRVHFPFKRLLYRADSTKRRVYYALSSFSLDSLKFNLASMQYSAVDPASGKAANFNFVDMKQRNKDAIVLVKYDPRTIEVMHSPYTKESRFLYRIPNSITSKVKSGDIFQINNLSQKMLMAIRDNKNFLFTENEMFHFKAPTISGVSDSDYGLPELLANFRLLHLLQVYRKIDEQVGRDYMLPFRLMSLDDGTGKVGDKVNANLWKQEMSRMIATRRKDKTAIMTVPFPVTYQEFGAQGKSLTPKELIEYQTNNMLNAVGIPAELYTMSLQMQSLPSAIRLFEQVFWFIHEQYNNFARWVMSKILTYLNNQHIDVSIQRPSLADRIEQQNLLLQLYGSGEVARETVFRTAGIEDPVAEYRRRKSEDAEFMKIDMEAETQLQQELDSEASLAAAIDDGSMAAGAQEAGATPMDKEEQAVAKAQEWLGLPEGERTKAMTATKGQDMVLYSLAKEVMEQIRSQHASAGRQQAYQQEG